MSDECPAAHELVAYLNGELPVERKAEIDRHLDECRLCATAAEGVAQLESKEDYLRSAESIVTRIRARTSAAKPAIPPRTTAWRLWSARDYLALAATLVVGVGMTVYLLRPGGTETLFQRYFEPYPSIQPIVRGEPATDARSDALVLYEARDYRGALAAFERIVKDRPDDPVLRFYTGQCRLALGRGPEAIRDFEETRKLGANELVTPAEWYLALAHLRSGHVEEARVLLRGIVERRSFYEDKARALLRELDR